MICPCEKKGETSVVDSRPTEDGTAIRRRRLCECGTRFTTFERIQHREIMVIKKNGRKSLKNLHKNNIFRGQPARHGLETEGGAKLASQQP